MTRPLTDIERARARILKLWSIAMLLGRTYPKDIRGTTSWCHDNTAGSSCYGMPTHYHIHYHTNHEQPIGGVIT